MKRYHFRKMIFLALMLGGGIFNGVQAQQLNANFPIIPYPSVLHAGKGIFNVTAQTLIVSSDHRFDQEAGQLNLLLEQYLGKPLQRKLGPVTAHAIVLKYDASIAADEGYRLVITPRSVLLSAREPAGAFRGVETLRQLLPADEHSRTMLKVVSLPAVAIADRPVFAWRGMHLDVSRHFFSIDYLKKFIDLLALYKFNKLHLHLTDDQGWRIQIRRYPKLTEEGAWRTFNNQDSACMLKAKNNPDFVIDPKHIIRKDGKTLYGGFYTQQEMKGVVAYALARHIDIIPEIDMPGHMMAAINSYPFLTSNGENKWGKLFTTPVCPCKETTFEFAQNVFTEIMEIFPGKYIHIGGDEVDRSSWEQAESCKELMVKNNIRTTAELQSYFINRMEKFFNSKGRKLIGWDEILEDGISSTAVVMYWRSWVPDAPVKAARNGNQVVMSPGNPLYFDNDPDRNSLYEVYHFNPVPAKLTAAEAKGVIGAQANTWSEKIPSENRADYMIFPRMTALAEVLWTNKNRYESYLKRLKVQFFRLDALHVSYRLPDVPGLVEQNVFTDEAVLNPVKPLQDLSFHYTTDGSLPQLSSAPLNTAVKISKNTFIRLAAFTAGGRRGDVYDLHYTQQDFAQSVNTLLAKPGLTCNYYPGAFKNSRSVTGAAKAAFIVDSVAVPKQAAAPAFILKYQGYLDIPEDGIYSFFLNCDDGGILNIAGREVIDNDGPHGPFEKSGQVALRKGMQPLALDFIEGGGGYTLKLKYSVNGSQPKEIPSGWLKH
jgi:hexosaminidase